MPDEITDAIVENATGPAEVEVDGQRVKGQSLKQQIEADRYIKGQTGADKTSRGLRFSKLVPPGAV